MLFGNNFQLVKTYQIKNSPRDTHKFFTQIHLLFTSNPFCHLISLSAYIYMCLDIIFLNQLKHNFSVEIFLAKNAAALAKGVGWACSPPPWQPLTLEVVIPLSERFENQWKPLLSPPTVTFLRPDALCRGSSDEQVLVGSGGQRWEE